MRPRVLLAEPLLPEAEARLAQRADVVRPNSLAEGDLCRAAAECDAIVGRTSTPLTRRVFECAPRLRVVGVAGVGLDRVDVAAAADRGVAILSTPAAATESVADLAIELMLLLLRPAPRLAADYRAGRFAEARAEPHGSELGACTVGIVGMGRIGSATARRCAAGFGARVVYNDIADVGPFGFDASAVEKDELWSMSDIVSLHVPLTHLTDGLVDQRVMALMKPGALLINTCRGRVVDTPSLTAALEAGRVGGAALDVVEPEPLPPTHALFNLPNCVLTPHIAARTHEGLRRMHAVVDDVLAWLERRPSPQ